jgi:hypothetical protein
MQLSNLVFLRVYTNNKELFLKKLTSNKVNTEVYICRILNLNLKEGCLDYENRM